MGSPTLCIDGEEFTFVKTRSQMTISIYKGRNSYLRIGPKDLITKEINYHRGLLKFGFPVPEILSEGEYQEFYYFIESSFGDEHFGQMFRLNCLSDFTIRDTDFLKLLGVVKKFAHAQLQTANSKSFLPSNLRELIHVDILTEELPTLRQSTLEAFKKVENNTANVPSVLTHGDFNPYNIFEGGVIDWETGSYAPFGYDLVTNIFQTFFFPLDGDFEYVAGCRNSEKQIDTYWEEMNTLCASVGISKISEYINDFIFCRSVWATVRMENTPKLQEWRYAQYEVLLNAYLDNGDVSKFLQNY